MSDLASTVTRSFEHAYGVSTPYSIGVEEEFQLVDPHTFELVPAADELLDRADESERANIKHELMRSVLEIATPICRNSADARDQLLRLRARVSQLAAASGCRFASAGTHPFSLYEAQEITDEARYRDLLTRLKWIAQRELIFGLHVHVGMDSPDKAMYVFNHIRSYLPELLALSANSPFWQGRDTGLSSARSKVFDSFPRSGIPPTFDDWDSWESLMRRAMNAGAIEDYTYVWWDVRPHPRFGTIEVRVCDAQTRVEDSLALAALIQGTAAWLGNEFDEGRPPAHHPAFLINENKWNAARYGLDGELIDLATDTRRPTRDAIEQLIQLAEPHATALGSAHDFVHLRAMLTSTGSTRQREWLADEGTLAHVGRMLADESEDVVSAAAISCTAGCSSCQQAAATCSPPSGTS